MKKSSWIEKAENEEVQMKIVDKGAIHFLKEQRIKENLKHNKSFEKSSIRKNEQALEEETALKQNLQNLFNSDETKCFI